MRTKGAKTKPWGISSSTDWEGEMSWWKRVRVKRLGECGFKKTPKDFCFYQQLRVRHWATYLASPIINFLKYVPPQICCEDLNNRILESLWACRRGNHPSVPVTTISTLCIRGIITVTPSSSPPSWSLWLLMCDAQY